MAVNDDMLLKNPFEFPLAGVIINDSVRREALTPDQERRFLDFVQSDKHFSQYYDGIYILLNTGLRISEFCGLTLSDIDLEKTYEEFLAKISKHKYGLANYPHLDRLKNRISELEEELNVKAAADVWIFSEGIVPCVLSFTQASIAAMLSGRARSSWQKSAR
jgi:site-specific recombinase XerD